MDLEIQYSLIEQLTRQREVPQLCTTMGNIVRELTHAHYIKLHFTNESTNELSSEESDNEQNESLILTQSSKQDRKIIKEIDPVLLNAESPFIKHKNLTIMPLYADLSMLGVIVIDEPIPSQYQALIKLMLRVFVNQYTLINYCMKDALTGLFNRQAFDKLMKRLVDGQSIPSRRKDEKPGDWYFALADIDHFKHINDQFGHIYGDEVLLLFSRIMSKSFRDDDLLFRYGGEEFAIALRNVDENTSGLALERLRKNVESFDFPQVGKVTISVGYTAIKANNMISTLTDAADKALYYAKEHGRNQIRNFDLLVTSGDLMPTNYASEDVELF